MLRRLLPARWAFSFGGTALLGECTGRQDSANSRREKLAAALLHEVCKPLALLYGWTNCLNAFRVPVKMLLMSVFPVLSWCVDPLFWS